MYVELTASNVRPPEWSVLEATTAEYAVSSRWLDTMGPLLPGELHWLVAHVDGLPQVGMCARFLSAPPYESRYDIAAILRGEIPSFRPRETTWPVPNVESLYPAVSVVLPGYTCVPAGPGAQDPILLRDTVSAVRAWAAECGARSVSFLYVPERQHVLRRCLTELGATHVPLYPTCVLSIDAAGGIDGYLARLPRERQKGLRRLLRRLEEGGMTLGEADLDEVRDDVLDLRLGLLRKYNSTADRAVERTAVDRMIRNYPPEDRVVTTIRSEDRVVAFNLSLRHGATLRSIWNGQRPEVNGGYYLTVYYGQVAAALRRGIATIDYGTLRWQDKTEFGCHLEDLSGFTWHS
ncbi:GNAT family N-acetyltransferase [Nocardia sp. 2YAB30]|uniref:GNAT family N-acetyltransferase n=1 Tax=unclassified Nocardia TaxID=2637762 RepID=UPI003F9A6C94